MTESEKLKIMIESLKKWLLENDYNYFQCNDVPPSLFTKNHGVNVFLRTFFRMCPVNFRSCKNIPFTPQGIVSLLKAYLIIDDEKVIQKLFSRALKLRSAKSKNFSLKQGTRIAINLYENSEEDPTPLNTVWFGQALLDDSRNRINPEQKESILKSISDYLTDELGYEDHGAKGIYFYYGYTFKKEIINASAQISSFLIKVGHRYNCRKYIELGERGINYVISRQNDDGSWFYASKPERLTIDNFHQGYMLESLSSCRSLLSFDISDTINKGINYYTSSLFHIKKEEVIPVRYDKRFTPHNTWLFQKADSRDISTALEIFSLYYKDKKRIDGLVNYVYNNLFDKRKGVIACEKGLFWTNKIPYLEFEGWMLYSFMLVKNTFYPNY